MVQLKEQVVRQCSCVVGQGGAGGAEGAGGETDLVL